MGGEVGCRRGMGGMVAWVAWGGMGGMVAWVASRVAERGYDGRGGGRAGAGRLG